MNLIEKTELMTKLAKELDKSVALRTFLKAYGIVSDELITTQVTAGHDYKESGVFRVYSGKEKTILVGMPLGCVPVMFWPKELQKKEADYQQRITILGGRANGSNKL